MKIKPVIGEGDHLVTWLEFDADGEEVRRTWRFVTREICERFANRIQDRPNFWRFVGLVGAQG